MKKFLPIIIAVLVVGGGAIYLATRHKNSSSSSSPSTASTTSTSTSSSNNYKTVDACDILTQAVADQLIGPGAVKGNTSAGNVSSTDISVSNCTYTLNPNAGTTHIDINAIKTVSILARVSKTKAGTTSNKSVFTSATPAGYQKVDGYGDAALWNPSLGQLSILKSNNWYILNNSVGKVTGGTLDNAKKLADLIIDKL